MRSYYLPSHEISNLRLRTTDLDLQRTHRGRGGPENKPGEMAAYPGQSIHHRAVTQTEDSSPTGV